MVRPSVLCPIDFSDASRGALRYAAALAEHFYTGLTVLAVDDLFLDEAARAALGPTALQEQTQTALHKVVDETLGARQLLLHDVRFAVRAGRPAEEILRAGAEEQADAIVMSTRGASGLRKAVFGSTTERVLREAFLPVIVVPAADPGPDSLEAWRKSVKRVLAPIDLSAASLRQVRIARGLAEALSASLVLAHVFEPLRHFVLGASDVVTRATASRRAHANHLIEEILLTVPPQLSPVVEIGEGDPASEIARIASECAAGVIVMALHSSPDRGRRMGAVTYRLVCESPALVVAWPPAARGPRTLFATAA